MYVRAFHLMHFELAFLGKFDLCLRVLLSFFFHERDFDLVPPLF